MRTARPRLNETICGSSGRSISAPWKRHQMVVRGPTITQLNGFSPALSQLVTSLFLEEGHFSSHLRRMRSIYAAKRAELVAGLEPLLARGWSWSSNPAGFHLLIRHPDRELVRKTAARSGLDLALLSAYRIRRRADDGLFLRFGGLRTAELRTAIPELLRALTSIHVAVHGMPRTPP